LRFLVDANLSPRVAARLRLEQHDVEHVGDVGLLTAEDGPILAHAASTERVIVSADSDFATLLAVTARSEPSLILLRSADKLTPDQQADSSWPTSRLSPRTFRSARWSPSAAAT